MQRLTPKKQKKLLAELEVLLLDDKRKPHAITYFKNDDTFLRQLIISLRIILNASKNEIIDVKKATRSGYTTNFIIAALFLKKHYLIVEPTNLIAMETIEKAVKWYIEISGDTDIFVRMIPSNKIGCKLYKEGEFYTPILTSCKDCEEKIYEAKQGEKGLPLFLDFKANYCPIKTMMHEEKLFNKAGKEYVPNLTAITYDKLGTLKYKGIKNEMFNRIVNKMDGVLWDEFGKYIGKTHSAGMVWEHAEREGKVYKDTNIRDEYMNIKKFVTDNWDEINLGNTDNKNSNTNEIMYFLDTFIQPIVEKYDEMIGCSKPSYHFNPLSTQLLKISVKRGDYEGDRLVPKNQVLQMRMSEYSEALSYLNVLPDGNWYSEYLHDLMGVLTDSYLTTQTK